MVIGDPDSVGHVESTRGDGMSPEERAAGIISRYEAQWENWDDERAWVAEQIRAAVLEEREACAQVVESRCRFDENGVTLRGAINPELVNAAAAIRARV